MDRVNCVIFVWRDLLSGQFGHISTKAVVDPLQSSNQQRQSITEVVFPPCSNILPEALVRTFDHQGVLDPPLKAWKHRWQLLQEVPLDQARKSRTNHRYYRNRTITSELPRPPPPQQRHILQPLTPIQTRASKRSFSCPLVCSYLSFGTWCRYHHHHHNTPKHRFAGHFLNTSIYNHPHSQSQISIMSFADSLEYASPPTSSSSITSSSSSSSSNQSSSTSSSGSISSSGSSNRGTPSGTTPSSSPSLRQCDWREGGPLFFDLHTKLGVSYEGGHWFHMAENFLTARSTLRRQGEYNAYPALSITSYINI